MSIEPIAKYSSMGTTVILFANRMEVQLPGGIFGKKETILYRNIASLETPPLLNAVVIKTNDGKKHQISLLNPNETKRLKEQIESLL